MNRRNFLTTAAAGAALPTLAASTVALAGAGSSSSSAKLKVLLPATPPELLAELAAVAPQADLVICRNQREALEQVANADACYGFVTPELIRAGKSLKWVQQGSAGVEHLMEIPELVDSSIVLTNMQRAYAPEIADQALGYLLAFTRGFSFFVRNLSDQKWGYDRKELVLDELPGKTMVIIGQGGIGSEIARRAIAFGMRVIAYDPYLSVSKARSLQVELIESIDELLPRCDFITMHMPLTEETKHMIDARRLSLCKKGVRIVNCARGGLIDESALGEALKSGQIAAAALDVYEVEPPPSDFPLRELSNIVFTPHLGASTAEAQENVGIEIAQAIRAASRTAQPNAAIVAIADRLLKRDGRMIRAVESIGPAFLAEEGVPFRLDLE